MSIHSHLEIAYFQFEQNRPHLSSYLSCLNYSNSWRLEPLQTKKVDDLSFSYDLCGFIFSFSIALDVIAISPTILTITGNLCKFLKAHLIIPLMKKEFMRVRKITQCVCIIVNCKLWTWSYTLQNSKVLIKRLIGLYK